MNIELELGGPEVVLQFAAGSPHVRPGTGDQASETPDVAGWY